jgi:hypothetical protein
MNIDIEDVKKHLEKCCCQPEAKASYDIMAGGLIWDDEYPSRESCEDFLKVALYLRPIVAYRASLTLGKEREEFRELWSEFKKVIPDWPGFKEERIYGEAERMLRIHKYKEGKTLQRLEDEL